MRWQGDVRVITGVPVVATFANSSGSPIIIDDSTNTAYYLKNGTTVTALGGGGGGGITGLTGDVLVPGPTSGIVASAFDLTLPHAWAANQRVVTSALVDAGTVAVNALLGNNFFLLTTAAIGATRTIGTPSNIQVGMFLGFEIKQPAAGAACAVVWHADYLWGVDGTATAPATSTANSTSSYYAGYVQASGKIHMTQIGQAGAVGPTGPAGSPGPAFKVMMTADQAIAVAVQTKALYDTVLYDISTYWDTVNFRYKPGLAGKYRFVCNMVIDNVAGATTDFGLTGIWQNGVQSTVSVLYVAAAGQYRGVNVVDYDMNGTTDYVEVFGYVNTGGTPRIRGYAAPFVYNAFSGSFLHT